MPPDISSSFRKPLRRSGRTKHSAVSRPMQTHKRPTRTALQPTARPASDGTHTLFVDGSNLYSAQYKLFGPDKYLLFPKFVEQIELLTTRVYKNIYFYASYTPRTAEQTDAEKAFSKNEYLFYKSAKKERRVIFFTGYRSPTSGKEKEVDVKITADMVSMALMGELSSIHLLTGDADFLQSLETIKKYKPDLPMRLVCVENRPLYKGLYAYPSDIIQFSEKPLKLAKKATIHRIKKDHAALCVAKI